MITLNIVPPGYKRELKLFGVFLAIKNIVSLALIGIIAIAMGLLTAKIFLQNYFSHLATSTTVNLAGSSRYADNEIRTLKQELTTIHGIQAEYIPWSQLLLELGNQISDGIVITDLNVAGNGQAELSGMAKTRDDLLQFHDRLVGAGLAAEFEIPLVTKLQREDVVFRLSITLKIPHLQTP